MAEHSSMQEAGALPAFNEDTSSKSLNDGAAAQVLPGITAAPQINAVSAPNREPDTYARLVSAFSSFLAVCMHQILYLRAVYPQNAFLPVRQYNHAVRQSRHPRVCTWINDACNSVEAELLKCTTATVSFVILSSATNSPLERFNFDVSQMPRVSPADIHTQFASSVQIAPDNNEALHQAATTLSTSTINMEAQFRAVVARLSSACARLTPLPETEDFYPSLFITLREDADAPVGVTNEELMWIPAESDSPTNPPVHDVGNQFSQRHSAAAGGAPGGKNEPAKAAPGASDASTLDAIRTPAQLRPQTVPIRRVDAGEMKMEVWVEEALGKFDTLNALFSK
ncbi:hypothetical protein LOZ53_004149 [Ophidiomyces ophidiicola]|nr:hypothetical protein LOZ55_005551 [Ophidiomyces ophidiicola]KAI1987781.1 hypothetical protein LOZ53_004149 [Ophidiomyces ophidiicola]KAI1989463.1 hypothetical protein LOZ54_002873 [Ophidiomyces ophidiicola]KAI1990555.1 hypothetical protein LOZ51_004906 [Ophidiomyces ophidiicola]